MSNEIESKPIMRCGVGVYMGPYPAESDTQNLLDNIREQVNLKTGTNFSQLKAVSFKRMIMDGTYYIIKADAGNQHIHVKFKRTFEDKLELQDVQLEKKLDDEI